MPSNEKELSGLNNFDSKSMAGSNRIESDQTKKNVQKTTVPLKDLIQVPVLERESLSLDQYNEIESYKPVIENNTIDQDKSLYNPSNKRLLTAPKQELIDKLHQIDPRIEYFHYQLPEKYKSQLDSNGRLQLGQIHEYEYNDVISEPLADKVANEFPDIKQLAIRSVTVSINGGIADINKAIAVRDIRHVLHDGSDQPQDYINAARISFNESKNHYILHYRVSQFLYEGPGIIRRDIQKKGLNQELNDKIFPVLLVYDLSKLESPKGYLHGLPSDPDERKNIILKAIIVDKQ